MSVIRVVHNRENPYVQLNKKALWDENVSLKAIGLWARCMSRPDNWKFSVAELAKSGKEGKKAIYSAIDELIKEGYALRIEHYEKNENGKFSCGHVEYIFFEIPPTQEEKAAYIEEFKKCFPRSGFGKPREGHAQKAPLLKKEEETKDREEVISFSSPVPGDCPEAAPPDETELPSQKKDSKEIAPEASNLAQDLLSKIREYHPKAKAPDLVKWALELEKAHRIDKRSWEDLRKVMEWAFQDSFWSTTLQSADGLRRNFDKMWMKMNPPNNQGNRIKKNRETALSLINYLKSRGINNEASLMQDGIYCIKQRDLIKFDLSSETFDELICKFFKVRLT